MCGPIGGKQTRRGPRARAPLRPPSCPPAAPGPSDGSSGWCLCPRHAVSPARAAATIATKSMFRQTPREFPSTTCLFIACSACAACLSRVGVKSEATAVAVCLAQSLCASPPPSLRARRVSSLQAPREGYICGLGLALRNDLLARFVFQQAHRDQGCVMYQGVCFTAPEYVIYGCML